MTGRFLSPERHVHRMPPSFVDVDPDTARWLIEFTNLRAVFAARSRDTDRATVTVLIALMSVAAEAGSAAGSDDGTEVVGQVPASEALSVKQAARVIGIGERAVRKAIAAQRLPAQTVGGVYVIDPRDAHDYVRRSA